MSDIIKAQQGFARKVEVNRTHHFEDLYHLLCKREWIEEALQHVLDNDGAGTAGVDGMSWKAFHDVDKSDFENEKFRQHFIETLLKMLMEPIWEADFLYFSNGCAARTMYDGLRAALVPVMQYYNRIPMGDRGRHQGVL